MHYLDHSATTPVLPAALAAFEETARDCFGNPSSLHGAGLRAERALEAARAGVAAAMGAKPGEIIFTASGTEGDNLAVFGTARRRSGKGRIILTEAEHPAVFEPAAALAAEGYDVVRIPSPGGALDLAALETALTDDTLLVSVMMVSNETGAVNPVGRIRAMLDAAGSRAVYHIDAVQGFCRIPFTVRALGCDLLTVSGHKIGAPRGTAALFVREGLPLKPHILGGGQERGLRSGTENVAGAAAMAAAASAAQRTLREDTARLQELGNRLQSRLRDIPAVRIHRPERAAPHIWCLSMPGVNSETALHFLEQREIYLSAGSACNAKKRTYSRAHVDFGLREEELKSALRVSLAPSNTAEDIDALADGLAAAAEQLIPR